MRVNTVDESVLMIIYTKLVDVRGSCSKPKQCRFLRHTVEEFYCRANKSIFLSLSMSWCWVCGFACVKCIDVVYLKVYNSVNYNHSLPLCTSRITPSLFHSRLNPTPVVSLLGLPPRTFACTVSSELFSFWFYFFLIFFVSGPCARLGWPSRQLLSAR